MSARSFNYFNCAFLTVLAGLAGYLFGLDAKAASVGGLMVGVVMLILLGALDRATIRICAAIKTSQAPADTTPES